MYLHHFLTDPNLMISESNHQPGHSFLTFTHFHCSFFLLGSYNRSVAPETIGPSGLCVRVKGRRVKRQRESGAGSWVKGGVDPDGARGVVVAAQIAGGGEVGLFLVMASVLIETSDMTKTRLTGLVKGAAVTEQPLSSRASLSPPTSRSFIPLSRCISLCGMVVFEIDASSWEV